MTRTYVRSNWHSILEGAKKAYRIIPWCAYCGRYGTDRIGPDGTWWHIDHIRSLAMGGAHHPSNLARACHGCNTRKGAGCAPGRWWVPLDVVDDLHQFDAHLQPVVANALHSALDLQDWRSAKYPRPIDLFDLAVLDLVRWRKTKQDGPRPANALWLDPDWGWCVLEDTLL